MSLILIPDWLVVPPGLADDWAVVDTEVVIAISLATEVFAVDVSNASGDSFGKLPSCDVVVVDEAVDMALVDGQLPVDVLVLVRVDQVLSENGKLDGGTLVSSLFCRFGVECAALRGLDPGALLRSALDSLSGDGSFHCVRREPDC